MPPNVVNGATLMCSFGLAPATLMVLPTEMVMAQGQPAAVVTDSIGMLNVTSFGMCSSPANPSVAAATAAALGVLTPMPCTPVPSPWAPGAAQTLIAGKPALTSGSTCTCSFGGVIQIGYPGSTTVLSS